jgi:hypothetical protein
MTLEYVAEVALAVAIGFALWVLALGLVLLMASIV